MKRLLGSFRRAHPPTQARALTAGDVLDRMHDDERAGFVTGQDFLG